jgi:hypothetical protein
MPCNIHLRDRLRIFQSDRLGGGRRFRVMFAPHWTLRGEYLFVDLGSQSVTAPSLNTIFPPVNFTGASVFHENIARAAVNFGF